MSRFERDGAAPLQRPRRGRRGRARRRAAGALLRRLDPRRGGARSTPGSAATSSPPSASRPSWVADRLPLAEAQHELTGGLSPDTELGGGGFDDAAAGRRPRAAPAAVPAGHPGRLRPGRDRRRRRRRSRSSDAAGHRRLALHPARHRARPAPGARGRRGDPRPAPRRPGSRTPTSSTGRKLSSGPGGAATSPDAVVVFIGANEGYSMPGPDGQEVECCGRRLRGGRTRTGSAR